MYFAAHRRFPVFLLQKEVSTLAVSRPVSSSADSPSSSPSASVFTNVAPPSVAHQKSGPVRWLKANVPSNWNSTSTSHSSSGLCNLRYISSTSKPQLNTNSFSRGKVPPFNFQNYFWPRNSFSNSSANFAMDLKKVVLRLDEFAPTSLAGSWDNVGLLVEPTPPHSVSKMCLTNDLTEAVLEEAIEKKANFILSYHPPIFVPLKRLTMKKVKERIIVRAIENRIAIYSPHTCYDVVEGGVTDWLVEGLGEVQDSRPLEASSEQHTPSGDDVRVSFLCPDAAVSSDIQGVPAANLVSCVATTNRLFEVSLTCKKSGLGDVMTLVQSRADVDKQSIQIVSLSKAPMVGTGVGRIATLREQTATSTVVDRIKTHLNLSHVQVAIGDGKTQDSHISTVAICAGSGASVLKGVCADMYLTGEMSHHDILAAVAEGITVVVCNHSNTERGYLHVLQKKFTDMFENQVEVFVSERDRDPLQVV